MIKAITAQGLKAELATLDDLIKQSKKYGDAIAHHQYTLRAQEISEKIKDIEDHPDTQASVALFFAGKPVLGSRGIDAEFAGSAIENFQEIISRAFANTEIGVLGQRGPVPLKQATKLMVTDVARGSFGFVLDEINEQEQMTETALKTVVDDVTRIIGKVTAQDDAEYEDVVDRIDNRTLIALRDFFIKLDASEATIRIVEDGYELSLDERAIHRGRTRTESTSIEEEEESLSGTLMGFLPEHKKFELLTGAGEMIYGSVSLEAAEQFKSMIEANKNPITKRFEVGIRTRVIKPINASEKKSFRLNRFIKELND